MKRIMLLSTVLMAALLVPALASATHITEIDAIADCMGFNADIDVHFRNSAEYLDLAYEVNVLDANQEVVCTVSGTMNIVQEDGEQDITIMIAESFSCDLTDVYTVQGTFTLTSPYPDGIDEDEVTFESAIDCRTSDNEDLNFDTLKALYR